jgi:hypothetical protein
MTLLAFVVVGGYPVAANSSPGNPEMALPTVAGMPVQLEQRIEREP